MVYTKLKRLSVDIDLDYYGSLDKETTIKDRELIVDELDKYMVSEGYEISKKSRGSVALTSRIYKYENAFKNNDAIKVDINFLDRIHIYETHFDAVSYFNKTVMIKTPSKEELFGMKISALIDRSKPRDLYDTIYLINHMDLFNKEMLKKASIFYLSLNGMFVVDRRSFDRIKTISWQDIKRELLPVIKRDETFELQENINIVIETLLSLLMLDEKELQYLYEFSKGNYKPALLFDESIAPRIEKHPMAKWRQLNIK